jgi:FtsH-binding integral membrane protein
LVWSIGNGGFVLCCAALLALRAAPNTPLLWFMVVAQGTLGYSLTSVMGAIPAESFGIFGTVMLAAIIGGAAGPWIAETLHDLTGSYSLAFWLSIACSAFSAISIWCAAPRRGGMVCVEGTD